MTEELKKIVSDNRSLQSRLEASEARWAEAEERLAQAEGREKERDER